MWRVLLVPGAIIAVLCCGIWVHATRTPVSRSKAPSIHAAPVDRVAPAINAEVVQPAPSERANTLQPAARIATRAPVAAPRPVAAKIAEPQHAETQLTASMRIPADGAGESPGPALTIEEMQALARQESEGLVTIRNADGSETLNHEDRFREHMVLKVGADGQPEMVCVQGEAALKQALRRAPATNATKKTTPPATPKGDR